MGVLPFVLFHHACSCVAKCSSTYSCGMDGGLPLVLKDNATATLCSDNRCNDDTCCTQARSCLSTGYACPACSFEQIGTTTTTSGRRLAATTATLYRFTKWGPSATAKLPLKGENPTLAE